MKLKNAWLSDFKDEQVRTLMRQQIAASSPVLERLMAIIDGMAASAEAAHLSKGGYDSPNWAYMQADHIGYMRALKEIKELLDIG